MAYFSTGIDYLMMCFGGLHNSTMYLFDYLVGKLIVPIPVVLFIHLRQVTAGWFL